MLFAKPSQPADVIGAEIPSGINRRQALEQLVVGVGSVFGALALPRELLAQEPKQLQGPYKLRDIDATYQLWRTQSKATHLPSIEVFREAVLVCREAACSIFLMKGSELSASHSASIVSIPEEHQTPASRGKLYVLTCDHARLEHAGTRPIVQLANGESVQPQNELVAKMSSKGIPVKDLRIYECPAAALKGVRPLSLAELDTVAPQNAPVMTYEPLNLRASQIIDTRRRTVIFDPASTSKPVLEKLVLSHITQPEGFPHDPNYPETSGFSTAGQLKVGGSGSPVILFTENGFKVAGHQVSYGNRHDIESEDRIDGEIDNDGHVVTITHAIQLLKERGRWK